MIASTIDDVVKEFSEADDAIRSVFPKVDPVLVVRLIFDQKAKKTNVYTVEAIIKDGQDTETIRHRVMEVTGMVPGFYLQGTKMIVNHKLDLQLLKRINDAEFVVSVKGSPYGAGGSSDF